MTRSAPILGGVSVFGPYAYLRRLPRDVQDIDPSAPSVARGLVPGHEIQEAVRVGWHRVPGNAEQHLAADHHRMRDRVGVNPEDEDKPLAIRHGYRDDLGHRLGDDRMQAASKRVMLGLRDTHQPRFSRGVLVLDTDEDDAAIGVAQRSDRLGDVILLSFLRTGLDPAYDAGRQPCGSLSSSAPCTWTAGPRACGSSPAGSARTPASSCGSPTSAATAEKQPTAPSA